MCFKITEPEKDNGVPIFATKIMRFEVLDTIESNEPIPEQYPQWKDVLDNYAEEKKGELDTYTTEMQTDLKAYKKDLENEMSTTKDTLTGKITATATEETNKFNTNAESKTNAFNDNATEKTTNYNTNAETKLKEYNDNATTKTEEYNTNATNKVNEFNENVDSLENELTELANQMPWNTTEIQDSIHVEDSAKYSRNKLDLFGNLEQEKREGYNLLPVKNISQSVDGVDFIINNDGTILANGTATKQIVFYVNTIAHSTLRSMDLKAGNYKISSGVTSSNNTYFIQGTYASSGTDYYPTDLSNAGNFSITEDVKFGVSIIIRSGITLNNVLFKPMLVAGTEIKPYEPYGAMPSIEYPSMPVVATGVQKIKRIGKNFLNVEKNASTTVFGATATTDENGIVTINGTTTGAVYLGLVDILKAYSYGESSKLIKSKLCKGVYKVSFKYISGTATSAYNNTNIQFRDGLTNASSTIIKSIANLGTSDKAISVTLDKDKEFYTYLWADTNTTFTNYKFTVLIEKVESETDLATAYEPYKEEKFELDLGTTELCKIVDENNNVVAQDRVVYKDGKWQFEKNVYKELIELSNNKGQLITSYMHESLLGIVTNSKKLHKKIRGIATISNVLKSKHLGATSNTTDIDSVRNAEGIALHCDNTTQIYISLKRERLETEDITGARNFINQMNLICYYPIESTEYQDCTPAQSTVLDKLHKLTLQQGTNNIYVESENGVTTELQLTYMQDLMSQINELKQAMLNIGGN